MPMPGYLTPSTFDLLMKNGRDQNKPGQAAINVMKGFALDMMGVEKPEISSPSLTWGNEYEKEAIAAYEMQYLLNVSEAKFKVCSDLPFVGGTCDGIVGNNKIIEVKNPYNPINHLDIRKNFLDNYFFQVMGYMWIYDNVDFCDFISFDVRYPQDKQLCVLSICRDDVFNQAKAGLYERCLWAYDEAMQIINNWQSVTTL